MCTWHCLGLENTPQRRVSLEPNERNSLLRYTPTVEKKKPFVAHALAIIILAAGPVLADDVYLRGGGQITGQIVEQTEDSVTVDVGGGGTISAHMSSVVRIEKSTSPLQEYRKRAAQVPEGDAEAWRKLARWATGNALTSQAMKAYSQVVAILPDDEEANRALGRVWFQGKWVTEEESYVAQGYVQFEGQWMTPGERQAILADRQAREKADRQANNAKIKELEDQMTAEKNQKAEEQRAFRDPNKVAWGWGYGPGYWPRPGYVGWPSDGSRP